MVYCWAVAVKRAVNNKHCKESSKEFLVWARVSIQSGNREIFPGVRLSIMIPPLVLIGALHSKYPESQSS